MQLDRLTFFEQLPARLKNNISRDLSDGDSTAFPEYRITLTFFDDRLVMISLKFQQLGRELKSVREFTAGLREALLKTYSSDLLFMDKLYSNEGVLWLVDEKHDLANLMLNWEGVDELSISFSDGSLDVALQSYWHEHKR